MREDVTLLTTEKNRIFILLQEHGLDPLDFGWRTIQFEEYGRYSGTVKNICSELRHSRTGFSFVFGKWSVQWSPSFDKRTETNQRHDWNSVLEDCEVWCVCLKREVGATDLWAELQNALASFQGDAGSNEPFAPDMQATIIAKLDAIETRLIEQEAVRNDNRRFFNEQFQYLRESITRLGRLDWKNSFMGVVTNLVTSGIFDPKRAGEIVRSTFTAVGSVLSNVSQLPPIP